MSIPPVIKTMEVPWGPDEAFRRFTAGIATWWPLKTHSVGTVRTVSVVFEERVGGTIHEVVRDGTRHVWGTVLEWDPPTAARFTWHPGRPRKRPETSSCGLPPVEAEPACCSPTAGGNASERRPSAPPGATGWVGSTSCGFMRGGGGCW